MDVEEPHVPVHVIRQGLDIPLIGAAAGPVIPLDPPRTVALDPTEHRGFRPRPVAREGAIVAAGDPVLQWKEHPEAVIASPVDGRVVEIRRGPRRVITDVVIERTGDRAASFKTWSLASLERIARDDARSGLLGGGLWTIFRTRPLDRVPAPDTVPQSILVGAMESGPLQPGPDVLLGAHDAEALQAGLHVLRALTDGKVYLAVADGSSHPALTGAKGVEVHAFRGPHPAGDPAVQVNLVDPPRGRGEVWWARAWDVARVGRLFLEGRYPSEAVYAAVGPAVKQPRLVRTVIGAPLADIVGPVHDGPTRWIRGSTLSGHRVDAGRWASATSRAVTVLHDEVERALLGWMTPQLGRWAYSRSFLRAFFRAPSGVDMRPGLWGGHRSIIPVEVYRDVIATPDIDTVFLFKSIVAGDMEESVALGMLDLTPEEAALLTYVCPAKIEYDVLLERGLARFVEES